MPDAMSWTYRVIRTDAEDGSLFRIYEVYTEPAGLSWTEEAMEPMGETLDDLRSDLEARLKALDEPVLLLSELEKGVTNGEE